MRVKDVEGNEEKTFDTGTPSNSSGDIRGIQDPSSPSRLSSVIPQDDSNRPLSIRSEIKQAVIVPKHERRGWLARVSIVAEVYEPKHYENRTKWFITFIVAIAAAAAPMGSGIVLRMACIISTHQVSC